MIHKNEFLFFDKIIVQQWFHNHIKIIILGPTTDVVKVKVKTLNTNQVTIIFRYLHYHSSLCNVMSQFNQGTGQLWVKPVMHIYGM